MKTKRITESILDTILYLSGLFNLILNAFKNLPSLRIGPVRTVFFRQIYFAGIETFRKDGNHRAVNRDCHNKPDYKPRRRRKRESL